MHWRFVGIATVPSSNLHLHCLFRLMPIMLWVLHRWVSFSEMSLPLFCILYVWCLFWCLFSAFRCHIGCHIHLWGSTIGVCTIGTLWSLLWQAYVQPCDGNQPTPGMHRVAAPSTTLSRGNLMLLSQLFPSHPNYMVGPTALGA